MRTALRGRGTVMLASRGLVCLVGLVACAGPACAHVSLLAPNGGESLVAGGSFEIRWEIAIPHNLENWDLYYARDLGPEHWVSIIENFEAGDPSQGSMHSYIWTVPDLIDDTVWVRVVMDNDTADYQDQSLSPFSIVPAPGTGLLMLAGLAALRRR